MNVAKIQEFQKMIHDIKNDILEVHQDPDGILEIEINGHLQIQKIRINMRVHDQKLEETLPGLINSSICSVSLKIKNLIEIYQKNLIN
jgi:DNA-binding protein YbaB